MCLQTSETLQRITRKIQLYSSKLSALWKGSCGTEEKIMSLQPSEILQKITRKSELYSFDSLKSII